MTGRSVLVVGAGIAGLSAAYRLSRAGHRVRVLEAADAPGGRMAERTQGGITYNTGARLVYGFSPPFMSLVRELGLAPSLVPLRRLSAVCGEGRDSWRIELLPGPASLAMPGLTLGDRLRLLRFSLAMLLERRRVSPDDLTTAIDHDGETLSAHIGRALGPRVLERLIEPVFRGTRSWNPEEISAAFFLSVMPHMVGRRTVYGFAGGMGEMTAALAGRLEIACDTTVTRIEAPAEGPCQVHASSGGVDSLLVADLVVCAVEGSRAAALLPGLGSEDLRFLKAVRYNALGIVHYAIDAPLAPVMRFFPRRPARRLATYQQIPGSPARIYAQLSPEAVAEAAATGRTDDLDALVAEEVRALCPGLDLDAAERVEQWIDWKLPVPYPGYGTALSAFRQRQAAAPRRVYLCGDYLAQALVTGAAASGFEAARLIGRHWG